MNLRKKSWFGLIGQIPAVRQRVRRLNDGNALCCAVENPGKLQGGDKTRFVVVRPDDDFTALERGKISFAYGVAATAPGERRMMREIGLGGVRCFLAFHQ